MGKSIVVLLSVVLSTTAFAQETTESGGAPSKTAIAAPAQATSTAKVAAPADTRTVKGEAYTKHVMEGLSQGDSSVYNEAFLGINKTLSNGQKIGARQLFILMVPENGPSDSKDDVHMASTYFYHVAPNIVKLNENLALSTTNRLYLGTGEAERFENKQLGRIRNYLNLVQKFGKLELSANLLTQWRANTQDLTNKVGADGSRAANEEFYIVPYAEAGYAVTETVSTTVGLGLENFTYRAGPTKHVIDTYAAIGWQALKQLSINLTVEHDGAAVNNPNGAYQLGRANETYGVLELSASL